jgi:hypothetical protein
MRRCARARLKEHIGRLEAGAAGARSAQRAGQEHETR